MLPVLQVRYVDSYDLSRHSSVRIGPFACAAFPENVDALTSLVHYCKQNSVRYYVLGAMSNTLAPDSDNGALYIFTTELCEITAKSDRFVMDAGVPLSRALLAMARDGCFVLPSLVGIPGSIGGAIYSNAGAFSEDISMAVIGCEVYDPLSDQTFVLSSEDMHFSYRHSLLREQRLILLRCHFARKSSFCEQAYRTRCLDVVRRRKCTQPCEPSLGSVFMAHNGRSVARLIDEMGLKGKRIGNIQISPVHAGFFVNLGNGNACDFRALLSFVQDEILQNYGFSPSPEITIL